jgi:hypothetical protein
MKKLFSIAIVCCLFAMTGIFSSCTKEDGDWIFSVQLDPSNETPGDQNSYEAFINPIMTEAMKADADRYQEPSNTFIFRGEKSKALKRAENAFDKGVSQVKGSNSGNMIAGTGIKINLCRSNRDTNQDEVVRSYTF